MSTCIAGRAKGDDICDVDCKASGGTGEDAVQGRGGGSAGVCAGRTEWSDTAGLAADCVLGDLSFNI